MTDPRLVALESDSPQAARLAELASLAVRVDTGLLRRLRREFLRDAPPAIEADLWFSQIVESRGARGFQIVPGLLPELRGRLSSSPDRPAVAEVRRVTAEAHQGVSPLIELEERVNGLAVEKGTAARSDIDEALRPVLFLLSQGNAEGMRVARWAQNAAARFHAVVAGTTSARGLIVVAAFLLQSPPRVAGESSASIADIGWAFKVPDGAKTDDIGVVFVEGGIRFGSPSAVSIAIPRIEPRLVGIEWSTAAALERRLVEPRAGLFVPLTGNPATVTMTTLAGEQYRLERTGAATAAAPRWAAPAEPLLGACVQIVESDDDPRPIGVAFAIDWHLFITERRVVGGKPRVRTNRGLTLEVWDWGPDELDDVYDDSFVPLHLLEGEAEAILENFGGVSDVPAAAVAGFEGDAPRWFEMRFAPSRGRSASGVVAGTVPQPPRHLHDSALWAAFGGAPVVSGDHLIGAVASVRQEAGSTDLIVMTPEYLQSVIRRARRKYSRLRPRLSIFVSSTAGLSDEREAVRRAILETRNQPVMEEDWAGPSSGGPPGVGESDVLVLVVGTTGPREGQHDWSSAVEAELEQAWAAGKACLVFIKEMLPEPAAPSEWLLKFRGELQERYFTGRFKTPQELQLQVIRSLEELKRSAGITGSPSQEPQEEQAPVEESARSDAIFISYASDDRQRAEQIARVLTSAGLKVWTGDSKGGISVAVAKRIQGAALFVPLLSRSAAGSQGFREDLAFAFDWVNSGSANERFIRPITIDPISTIPAEAFPESLRHLNWLDASDGLPARFIQDVRESLERVAGAQSSAVSLFGVPAHPEPLTGRANELRELERLLTAPDLPDAKVTIYPNTRAALNVITLAGAEGVGRWTLAHHAVTRVASQFPDGVIWLGEDGMGYPRAEMRAYAEANSLGGLFKEDIVDRDRFREAFARRRVLFVADQRFASDMLPTVLLAGPGCVALRLLGEARQDSGHVLQLEPLTTEESHSLLSRHAGREVTDGLFLDFAGGRPLLLKLLGGAVASASYDRVQKHLKDFEWSQKPSYGDARVLWMVRFLAGRDRQALETLTELLSARQRPLVAESIGRETVARLVRLGVAETHGDYVRVHRAVESAVSEATSGDSSPPA